MLDKFCIVFLNNSNLISLLNILNNDISLLQILSMLGDFVLEILITNNGTDCISINYSK